MPPSKLQRLADEMITAVRKATGPRAWVQRTLAGGLDLVYSRDGDQHRLALRREKVPPSPTEVEVCAAAFRVPEGTEPRSYLSNKTPNLNSGRLVRYQVVELTWREIEPARTPARPAAYAGATA
jgi:hypothetical protein